MRTFSNKKLAQALNDPRYKLSGIASMVGVTSQSLYAIKDGRSTPSVNTLVALADILEKPLDYFFENECNHTYKEAANG